MLLRSRWVNYIHPETRYLSVIIWAGTIAVILGRLTGTMADPDLWGYMSFGRLFWNGTEFPYHDIFSYTPTKSLWVYHEWLTGVIFYPIYKSMGSAGLQGLKYIIGFGTVFLIYKTARIRGASTQSTIIWLLLISPFFSMAYSPVRAQIFSNLFFVLTFYILEKTRLLNRPYYLGWLVPLYLLWANLHGGFVAGLGMIGLFAAGELVSKQDTTPYWLILVPTTFITLINPYGLQYWIYLKDALFMSRPNIGEWHSLFFALQNGEYSTNILIFIIIFILAFLMFLTSDAYRLSDIFLAVATSFLAIKHVRHQSLFFLIMGCCGPIYFTGVWDRIRQSKTKAALWKKEINILIIAIFLFFLIFFGARLITGHPFALTLNSRSIGETADYNYPIRAIEFIRHNGIKGNILTEFSWGEYIIWSLPGIKVAMDGRYETIYTEMDAQDYFEFTEGGVGWREYLHKYPHDMILFRQESIVATLLRSDNRWTAVYSDDDCVLFMRREFI